MNCKEFNQTMNDFFHESIADPSTLEAFLAHYHSCKSCREEMEIQYILNEPMEIWESDSIYDFSGALQKVMEQEEEELTLCRLLQKVHFRMMVCAGLAIIVVLVYQFLFWMM